jgi:hypothetical protein
MRKLLYTNDPETLARERSKHNPHKILLWLFLIVPVVIVLLAVTQ